jgi:hypothetical protein
MERTGHDELHLYMFFIFKHDSAPSQLLRCIIINAGMIWCISTTPGSFSWLSSEVRANHDPKRVRIHQLPVCWSDLMLLQQQQQQLLTLPGECMHAVAYVLLLRHYWYSAREAE